MSKKILVIAAHPDDEVLGCGGTIARHTFQGDEVLVLYIADGVGARSLNYDTNLAQRKQAAQNAATILKFKIHSFLDLPDNRLDTIPLLDIVQKIEVVIKAFQPQVIYTHHYSDLNIDHTTVYRAALTACRPLPNQCVKEIYTFEVLSSTEWATNGHCFIPNCFVDIKRTFNIKLQALAAYGAEIPLNPHPRSAEATCALATNRGASVGKIYCESFQIVRIIYD